MPEEHLNHSDELKDHEYSQFEKPTIKILIYTDDPTLVTEGSGLFGLGRMISHLAAHKPAFANISISFVSRNSDSENHADNKLDDVLDRECPDQVWFFGIHQINKAKYTLGIPGGGGPESELNKHELSELGAWMRVGTAKPSIGLGVLMTGDHANPPPDLGIPTGPNEFCPPGLDHEKFLCLGRALGHEVPRAGLLRKWKGAPTRCVEDSFNTQVRTGGTNIESSRLQIDNTPQQLILETFDAKGNPQPGGEPHPLFRGKAGRWIDVFPDHMHEGPVIIPKSLDTKIWPRGPHLQPEPREIAFGTDKRNGKRISIVAAYDGDSAGVGRIVADSTWHHYFNINLTSFPPTDPEGTPADLIGQFYSNLAVWLCPLAKRRTMGQAMFEWLATHPLMLEEVGSGPLNLGNTAYQILLQMASLGEINELFQATCPDSLRGRVESIYFPDSESTDSFLPSKQLILGSVINEYHNMRRAHNAVPETSALSIIERGFSHAFGIKTLKLIWTAAKALETSQFLPLTTLTGGNGAVADVLKHLDEIIHERKTTMSDCTTGDWTIELRLDKNGNEETFAFDIQIDPATCRELGGIKICEIHGWVFDALGTRLSALKGRCRSTAGSAPAFMDLEFHLRRPGVEIFMTGVVPGGREFRGVFRAHAADFKTPPPADKASEPARPGPVDPETGDTGTGSGSQTVVGERETKA